MNKVFTKLALTLSVMALVLAFSACNNDKENVQRFKDAAMNLDNTSHTLTDVYDYWPVCGIRVTGSHLASLISLEELEKMFPCPLYASGPHHDGQWDLDNEAEFGHYNPKAIQYLANLAKKVVADKQFVEKSKNLVDQYLYDKMLIMMVLHDALYDEGLPSRMDKDASVEETRNEILNELVENKGFCYEISCFFRDYVYIDVDSWTGNGSEGHFLYFWARRWKDGTIDQFYDALSTVFKAYHPEYQYRFEDFYRESEEPYYDEEEEFEGDWWPIYNQVWHALLQEHAKLGENNDLLDYGDEYEADGYYEEYNTNDGIDIAFPGTEQGYYHAFKCFPLENGTMKVYEYVAWVLGEEAAYEEPTFEPSFSFNSYHYDHGTLTPMALEPEIAECISEASLYRYSPATFTENGVLFNNGTQTKFVWDGEKMVKE